MPTVYGSRGAVCSVDALASSAGIAMLRAGGTAVDAAVAASAVLAVTSQHMCGMGGDLLAVVHPGRGKSPPEALLSVGRAGSGADPRQLRDEGRRSIPFRDDVRCVTVPGCVDGWVALHERFGRLPFADVLAPAIELALDGFPTSPLLSLSLPRVAHVGGGLPPAAAPGSRIRRPLIGRALQDIAVDGRNAWYAGDFGRGLVQLGNGLFTPDDLARSCVDWHEPLRVGAGDWTLHGTAAPSGSFLALTGAAVADRVGAFGGDPDDPRHAHLLVESARAVGHDRRPRLHDGASAEALLDPADLDRRASLVADDRIAGWHVPGAPGGTIFLVAADADGMAVSLGNSNASGFGSHLAVPEVGVYLQNRGIGFSLVPGSPDELRPGARPPHTLAPLLVTHGSTTIALGTMGGDSQPQVLLQLLARLRYGGTPGDAVDAPRWALAGREGTGFDTWDGEPGATSTQTVRHEPGAGFADGLRERGHVVEESSWGSGFGHAHVAVVGDESIAAASDPRALSGSATVC